MTQMEPWGKANSKTSQKHHLAHHMMDVAAVFESLISLDVYKNRLQQVAGSELPVGALVGWAYLHDIGKLAPAFQAKAWKQGQFKGYTQNHLKTGWDWFKRNGRDPFLPWIRPETGWCEALMAHHGVPIPVSASHPPKWESLECYNWKDGEKQVLMGLEYWCPNHKVDLPVNDRLIHLCAGLLSLADWIGSDENHFKYNDQFDPDYGETARQNSAKVLSKIGLATSDWRPKRQPQFNQLTGFSRANSVQEAVATTNLDEKLIILEAETGSGKTEAALLRFADLFASGRVDGLYFALPTRAAASQIQRRISSYVKHWLHGSTSVTLAVPGQIRVDEVEGYKLPEWKVLWDEPTTHHWAAEKATRFLAAPIAIGTVDQAMMAGLHVKHAPMRAASLSRSLLVIDEIHASDCYMNIILKQLIEDHLAVGGYAMLMSATLGSSARSRWLQQEPKDEDTAVNSPYPAVWTKRSVKSTERGGNKSIEMVSLDPKDLKPLEERAIHAAKNGARVLIIRNTVGAAQDVWRKIREYCPELLLTVDGYPTLHHARFATEDRLRLDQAVETALGKDASSKGVIVIGTQTLEQALDIDADLLFTDLCPMDVLLQRLGRLHRHNRARPNGYDKPIAHILLPSKSLDQLAKPDFENGLGAWVKGGAIQGIYINLPSLEATRRMIIKQPIWHIPAMNRKLVESSTHDEPIAAIVEEMGWTDYATKILARELAMCQQGDYASYCKDGIFHEFFRPAQDDTALRTRLGGEGPIYELAEGTIGAFGHAVKQFALPVHWSQGLTGKEEAILGGGRLTIDRLTFLYDQSGLSKSEENDDEFTD